MATADYLREQAERCRRLARRVSEDDICQVRIDLSEDFERKADEMEVSERTGPNGD